MGNHESETEETGESSGSEEAGIISVAGNNGSNQEETFVKKETRRVFMLRLLVIAVLLATSAAVSVVVYYITHNGEQYEFESQYEAAADKVIDAFLSIARDKMGPAGSLVVALVAHGIDHTRQWPFVALSSFQQRASTAKRQSGSIFIATHPIVWREDRLAWENYTKHDVDINWYQEGRQYQVEIGVDGWDTQPQVQTEDPNLGLSSGIASHIYNFRRDDPTEAMISPIKPFYLPVWQTSPVTKRTIVNQNRASNSDGILTCLEKDAVVFEGMQSAEPGYQDSHDPVTSEIAWLLSLANGKNTKYQGDIFTTVYFPVYDSFEAERSTVGVMGILIYWQQYFVDILPEPMKGVVFVLDDGCDEPYTYQINGEEVIPLGRGDLHDSQYDRFERSASFLEITNIDDGTKNGLDLNHEKCPYRIRTYPSTLFYQQFSSRVTPIVITCAVALVFVFTVFMFFLYDRLVEKRQQLIMRKAQQTHGIVASLFPKNVRDRLLQEHHTNEGDAGSRIKSFISAGGQSSDKGTAAIADLFPESTVFFSDISGFTAWSSTREPSQVFVLLQALYQAYDKIAARLNVFKVETIGDSYVAVTGLPDPQPQHAVIMAKFAAECMVRTIHITRELEPILGPGTGDLQIRIGLHSGPVTAGVLMGDRARFQLFGDTVNTASRMESTGKIGMIQVSKETADLLIDAGKQHWVRPREDDVVAKGKGILQTYWVAPHSTRRCSNGSSESGSKYSMKDVGEFQPTKVGLNDRLVDWMVELLASFIKNIKVKHAVTQTEHIPLIPSINPNHASIEELVECLNLPCFDAKLGIDCSLDKTTGEVDGRVKKLLREYVMNIASAYRDNPFHNFEHACHVTMSASKLLSRIESEKKHTTKKSGEISSRRQDYMHGICSDPVAMFAIVFSALIHDVDHRGVSNAQLMKEEPILAEHFKNKSIAEQNSLEIAWTMLLSDHFKALREGIFASPEEFAHFRQVVVNVVLSTDIFDMEMSDLRKKRWNIAFNETTEDSGAINEMRATVAIEHIIQASDVAHTMQHWHVYRKWNNRLFHELLVAYRAGRLGSDPCTFWYKGELNFFDTYVIPLARKLKDCKVFGVSSDECLNYAMRNRDEWEAYGEEIVEQMKEEYAEE